MLTGTSKSFFVYILEFFSGLHFSHKDTSFITQLCAPDITCIGMPTEQVLINSTWITSVLHASSMCHMISCFEWLFKFIFIVRFCFCLCVYKGTSIKHTYKVLGFLESFADLFLIRNYKWEKWGFPECSSLLIIQELSLFGGGWEGEGRYRRFFFRLFICEIKLMLLSNQIERNKYMP